MVFRCKTRCGVIVLWICLIVHGIFALCKLHCYFSNIYICTCNFHHAKVSVHILKGFDSTSRFYLFIHCVKHIQLLNFILRVHGPINLASPVRHHPVVLETFLLNMHGIFSKRFSCKDKQYVSDCHLSRFIQICLIRHPVIRFTVLSDVDFHSHFTISYVFSTE